LLSLLDSLSENPEIWVEQYVSPSEPFMPPSGFWQKPINMQNCMRRLATLNEPPSDFWKFSRNPGNQDFWQRYIKHMHFIKHTIKLSTITLRVQHP